MASVIDSNGRNDGLAFVHPRIRRGRAALRIDHETGDPEVVAVYMIGDDEVFAVDAARLRVVSDDDYCGGCGQVIA